MRVSPFVGENLTTSGNETVSETRRETVAVIALGYKAKEAECFGITLETGIEVLVRKTFDRSPQFDRDNAP